YYAGGTVDVLSSVTGATILAIGPSDPGVLLFGVRTIVLGDVNGDGTSDVAATGATGTFLDLTGFVEVRSGKDGSLLARFGASGLGMDSFGLAVGGAPAAW